MNGVESAPNGTFDGHERFADDDTGAFVPGPDAGETVEQYPGNGASIFGGVQHLA